MKIGKVHHFKSGFTVNEVLKAAVENRVKRKLTKEPLFVAVFVKRPDGLIVRYSTKLEPGRTRAEWEVSG
jgi:hypothetical protein